MPPLKLADDRIAALSQLWKAVLSEPPSQNLNELWKEHTRIRQVLGVSDDEEPFDLHRQYQVSGSPFSNCQRINLLHILERAECIEKLKEWLIQQQIDISTVSIRPVSYGFGLFAARDLAANTTPIAVPHNALLSLDYGAVCSPIRFVLPSRSKESFSYGALSLAKCTLPIGCFRRCRTFHSP